jgi:putative FmdB family regulatory protein
MPRYDYQCKACSLKFEVKRRFDESVEADCPQCSGEARRLFSPVPIVFKGPGFYVTDNAAENSSNKSSDKRDEEKTTDKEKESEPAKDKKNEVMVS